MKHYKQPDGKLDAYIGVSFQVRPDFKTWDPFANNPIFCFEWHTQNVGVLSAKDLLKALAAGGAVCIREQPGDLCKAKYTSLGIN
jgi:hypothetical protein